MSCVQTLKPLRPSAFRAFLGLKSPKTRRSILSAPRQLSVFWVTFWVRKLCYCEGPLSRCLWGPVVYSIWVGFLARMFSQMHSPYPAPIRTVSSGIVRIEHSVETKMI